MSKYEVIIIGTSHHNTLSMVRAFGLQGIKPTLLLYGCHKSYISKSKFVKDTHYFDSANEVISHLKYNANRERNVYIISCTDEIAHKLDEAQCELLPYYNFFRTKKQGDLTYYMDKQKQLDLAKQVGFCAPWSSLYTKELCNETISIPCIIKPLASINGGKHIRICNSLCEYVDSIREFDGIDTLVQELIIKDSELVIVGLTVKGKTIIPAYIDKHREIKGGTTYSTVRSIDSLPKNIQESCVRMVEQIGYEGLWGIECIVSKGLYYFLELNLRNDATTYAVAVAGVNMPNMYVQLMENNDCMVDAHIVDIKSIVEHNDLIYAIKHKIPIGRWIKECRGAMCKYLLFKGDNKPVFALLQEYSEILLKKVIKRKGK